MISQDRFCANPSCPYHNVIDEEIIKRGIMQGLESHVTSVIERKRFVVTIGGNEKQIWFCSICAMKLDFLD